MRFSFKFILFFLPLYFVAWCQSRRGDVAIQYGLVAGAVSIIIVTAVNATGADVRDLFFNEVANAVSAPP